LALVAGASISVLLAGALSCGRQEEATLSPPAMATLEWLPPVPGTVWVHILPYAIDRPMGHGGTGVHVCFLIRPNDLQALIDELAADPPKGLVALSEQLSLSGEAGAEQASLDGLVLVEVVPHYPFGERREHPVLPTAAEDSPFSVSLATLHEGPSSVVLKCSPFGPEELLRIQTHGRVSFPEHDSWIARGIDILFEDPPPGLDTVVLGRYAFPVSAVWCLRRNLWHLYTEGVGQVAVLVEDDDLLQSVPKRRELFVSPVPGMVMLYRLAYYRIPGEEPIEWVDDRWIRVAEDGTVYLKQQVAR